MSIEELQFRGAGRVEAVMRNEPEYDSGTACLGHTAERIARLLQYEYGGAPRDDRQRIYFVPDHTLTLAEAARLGIRSELDLYGGVVPYAFVATRAATHPPVSADAVVPQTWSYALARMLASSVLRGYSAFSVMDACIAAKRLLRSGPVRIHCGDAEPAQAGETLYDIDACIEAIEAIPVLELGVRGVVVEHALAEETVHVVGSARIGAQSISYVGTRRAPRIAYGRAVHAGCDLVVVQGDFAALDRVGLDADERAAVLKAAHYDAALAHAYRPSFASRRCYDVVRGRNAHDEVRMGVCGQLWRCSAESPAEVAAMLAFRDVPGLACVRASTCEAIGEVDVPAGAMVYHRSCDDAGGTVTRYCTIDMHAS
ncbi:DUF3182 family protein [Dokdonella sp.]|uniref:DUF3182 family protein n=1 Tax=Dokdonella sp. TaxID=2291710 RepID=UPI002F41B27E